MERLDRKQICFDLDTGSLSEHYPGKSWNTTYYDIRKFMTKNDFEWIQGSVYESKSKIGNRAISVIIDNLISEHGWLDFCMRDCRVTSIGKTHNLTYLFGKEERLPKKEIARVLSMQKKR